MLVGWGGERKVPEHKFLPSWGRWREATEGASAPDGQLRFLSGSPLHHFVVPLPKPAFGLGEELEAGNLRRGGPSNGGEGAEEAALGRISR